MKKQLELLTSLSWVQRWLHNRSATAQKRPKSVVVCETYGSKMSLGDFQKKQAPSIAAMALMGKAITSFQPCEFQKTLLCSLELSSLTATVTVHQASPPDIADSLVGQLMHCEETVFWLNK